MATPSVGAVVLVRFPFSDLSDSKLRPGFVLADGFKQGSLQRRSYIRPEKLFTANQTLIEREVGSLNVALWQSVVTAIESILRKSIPEH